MKLSLWIIENWLEDTVQEIYCLNKKMTIAELRLSHPAQEDLNVQVLYVYAHPESGYIICQNCEDYIIFSQSHQTPSPSAMILSGSVCSEI